MYNIKLFALLSLLNEEEIDHFQKHLRLRYAREEVALKVFAYIIPYYPGFKDKKNLEPLAVYTALYGQVQNPTTKHTKKIMNAWYDLHNWLKEFVVLEYLQNNPVLDYGVWLSFLHAKAAPLQEITKFNHLFYRAGTYTQKKDSLVYFQELFANYFQYYQSTPLKVSEKEDMNTLIACSNNLDIYYALLKLKLSCEHLNRRKIMDEAIPDILENTHIIVRQLTENPALENHPLLKLYLLVFQLLHTGNGDYSDEIVEVITHNSSYIEANELNLICRYLHNFIAQELRKGSSEYWEKGHNLNKMMEKILPQREISATQLTNTVEIACKAKGFIWATDFIEKYKKTLRGIENENAIHLARAIIEFEKGNFVEAGNLLHTINFKNFPDYTKAKLMKAICDYETRANPKFMLSNCIALKSYLNRHKKSNINLANTACNFIDALKMLIRQKKEKEEIINFIRSSSSINYKRWLLEKTRTYQKR